MTRPQKIAEAQRLRSEGLTHREIGERLGVTRSCVTKWLSPESVKEWNRQQNAKRGPVKRQWERENRAECPSCGALMRGGSRCPSNRPERCADCVRDEARSRTLHFIELRKQGLTNKEIGEREGVPSYVVAVALSRAHRYGLTVPPSPYRNRARTPKEAAASGCQEESSR